MSDSGVENKPRNYRNGYSKKTVKIQLGAVDVRVPRDRNGEYEPQIIGKYSRKRSLEELAKLDRAGADLTLEEAERLATYKQRKAEAVKRCREKQKAAQPPKPQQRTLKELAECAEAGLPLTPEEAERLEAHRNRKKAALS